MMKKALSVMLAICLIMLLAFPASAVEFPDLKVTLISEYDSVEIGEEVKVTLSFNNASEYPYGLAAFCSFLTYDSSVLRVKSINAAVPRSSIRHNSMSGELRSIYTFASAQREPGFNTDGAFYTVTFEAVGAGEAIINVTFDAITVTDYETDELNFRVNFNSPSTKISVKGDEVTGDTSSVQSNASSKPESTTDVSSEAASKVPSTNDKPANEEFKDVADSGQNTVQDVFDDDGEIIKQTESKAPANTTSSNSTGTTIDDVDTSETNGIPNYVWIIAAVLVAAIGVAVVVVVIKKKK